MNACTPTAPLRKKKKKERGSGGLPGGPTEHLIQVAMHVRKMKARKWLPVIVPIKEQLRPGSVLESVRTAAVLGLPPPLNIQAGQC